MSRAQEIQALFEEIHGKMAVGYHRTGSQGMKALAAGQPFKIGPFTHGFQFGRGVYLHYDLKDQEAPEMSYADEYIVRAKVNLSKFLILDHSIMSKVYPGVDTIEEQLDKIFRLPRRDWPKVLGPGITTKIDGLDRPGSAFTNRTEDLAQRFVSEHQASIWQRYEGGDIIGKAEHFVQLVGVKKLFR